MSIDYIKEYFNNLQKNDIEDIKSFWKVVKPLLSDKSNIHSNIKIVKDNNILESDKEIADTFNQKFSNIVNDLEINFEWEPTIISEENEDPIAKAIEKFQNHPSILKIKEKIRNPKVIEFKPITRVEVEEIISKFDIKKGTSVNSISGKILKEHAPVYYDVITHIVNEGKKTNIFPNRLKYADMNPAFKPGKKNRTDIDNYRNLSVLPYTSKTFERDFNKLIQDSLDSITALKFMWIPRRL